MGDRCVGVGGVAAATVVSGLDRDCEVVASISSDS